VVTPKVDPIQIDDLPETEEEREICLERNRDLETGDVETVRNETVMAKIAEMKRLAGG
jgi:hypothetical protein